MRAIIGVIAGAAIAAMSSEAGAATYTYTGNNFTSVGRSGTPPDPYTASDRITGTLVTADLLAPNINNFALFPVSFSFSDGVNTIDNTNATNSVPFRISTDSSGNITDWRIDLSLESSTVLKLIRSYSDLATFNDAAADVVCTGAESVCAGNAASAVSVQTASNDAPGRWQLTVSSVIPEPSTWALMIASFAALGLAMRRRALAAH